MPTCSASPLARARELLTLHGKAATRFSEALAGDQHSTDQPVFDELQGNFTEADIVDLDWRIVTFID